MIEVSKKYDAVVFDMDGVIFDSEQATLSCWMELAEKYGFEDLETVFRMCLGTNHQRTKEIMLEKYGADFRYDEYAAEASVIYHARYDGGRLPMKPGVLEILSYLKDSGKKIALASSSRRKTVVNQLRDAKILDYFDAVICGDMVERSKPEPDIFLTACREIGVEPEMAFAIEDSFNGIRSAFAGRLRPIMVPDMVPANDEMREKAEVVLESLQGVVEYLNRMTKDN